MAVMKKILLCLVVCFTASVAQAQKLEFGVNGGLTNYSVHNTYNGVQYMDATHFQSSVIAPLAVIHLSLLCCKYQFGLSLGYQAINYKAQFMPEMPVIGLAIPYVVKFQYHDVPLQLFANRIFSKGQCHFYGGLFAGVIYENVQTEVRSPYEAPYKLTQNSVHAAAGLQAGIARTITKHIGIDAGVQASFSSFPPGGLDKNNLTFPISAGIYYKL